MPINLVDKISLKEGVGFKTKSCIIPQRTIPTSRQYVAIAAVDSNTFAVGFSVLFGDSGIDLIDHMGNVIRKISESLRLCCDCFL